MDWVEERGLKAVRLWLFGVAFMIVAMVVLGGLTRLTDSGLSMVEWKVVMGVVPPLSEADWHATFEKYKAFPQYKEHFPDMTLDEFKFIFFWEYSHRVFGRMIGLVFFLPLVFFLFKKWLKKPFIWRSFLLLFLGGLQGVVGWIMVKSGLVDIPRVDHLRLTLHLGLALFVFCLTLWYAYRLTFKIEHWQSTTLAAMGKWPFILLATFGLQILTGGMVAGLRAGFSFNTWPTMNGDWIPSSIWSFGSFFENLLENPVFVQFFHRWFAIFAAALGVFFALKFWQRGQSKGLLAARLLMIGLIVVQVLLGIGTLVMRVPISLASLHQLGAVLLLAVTTFFCQQSYDANRLKKGQNLEPNAT